MGSCVSVTARVPITDDHNGADLLQNRYKSDTPAEHWDALDGGMLAF
jgi:hypothetical protein